MSLPSTQPGVGVGIPVIRNLEDDADDSGFFINLPIGAVAVILLLAVQIPEEAYKKSREATTTRVTLSKLDFPGFFLFAGCAIMFLLALEWGGNAYAWRSSVIIGLFCGSGVVLGLFVAWQLYVGDEALLPPSMVRQRIVWCSCFVIFFFFAFILITSYYLPIYFQSVKGASPSMSGVYILPGIISQIIGAITSGLLGNSEPSTRALAVADLSSREVGVLSPVVCRWYRYHGRCWRIDFHLLTVYTGPRMDYIPNYRRLRPWNQPPNGKIPACS